MLKSVNLYCINEELLYFSCFVAAFRFCSDACDCACVLAKPFVDIYLVFAAYSRIFSLYYGPGIMCNANNCTCRGDMYCF